MKILILQAAFAAGLLHASQALTAQQPPPTEQQEDAVDDIDPSEIPNVFQMMDFNEDRFISRDEYATFFRNEGVEQDMRAFAVEDADHDNRISFDEFVGPKGVPEHDLAYMRNYQKDQQRIDLRDDLFSAMDQDADKFITRAELLTFFSSQGQVPQAGLFEGEDKDSDGLISWSEFSGPKGEGNAGTTQHQQQQQQQQQQEAPPQQKQQQQLPNLFVDMDANRDSRITIREMQDHFMAVAGESPDDTLFEREDKDGSGFISWEEFSGPKGTAPPDYSDPQFQKPQPNLFNEMDEDDDARVSKVEFERYFEEIVQKPPPPTLWAKQDRNEDGFLSWDEFSGPKGTRRPQPGDRQREMDEFGTFNAEVGAGEVPTTYVQPVLDINLFASMDANADHGITFEEMDDYFSRATDTRASQEQFQREDTDGNGRVSWTEFTGPKGASPDDRSKVASPEEVKKMNAENAQKAAAAARAEATKAQEPAGELNLFAEMDANGDLQLTREELEEYFVTITGESQPDNLFEEEDLDGDGVITLAEFSGPKGSSPQQEAAEPDDGTLHENLFANMDTDVSGGISWDEFRTYFDIATAEEADPQFFGREDQDSNGEISWEEFSGPKGDSEDDRRPLYGSDEAMTNTMDVFSELDLDGDRRITWEEFDMIFRHNGGEPDREVFESEDVNGDGAIIWLEFSGPKGLEDVKPRNFFSEMDLKFGNADGKIQRAEMNVWYMVESGETQDCPDHLWEASDKDSDGVVTWDEFDDSKGTILERPADDHTAPAWLAPDAAESDLGPLQKKLNVKCWLRPIVDEEAEDEKPEEVLQCLPTFMVIGTARSASTTLYDLLADHPSTQMYQTFGEKELNFWNTVPMCQPLDYAMLLPSISKGDDLVTAEGSVRYFLHPMVPPRLKHYLPDTKFIVTLRNPAFRMFSHWRMEHFLMEGRDPREDFNVVVQEELAKIPDDASTACFPASKANANPTHCFSEMAGLWDPATVEGAPYTNYLDWSTYHYQMDRWLAYFPLSQFKFVSFNELREPDGIDAQLATLHEFLGLPSHSYKDNDGNIRLSNVNDKGTDATLDAEALKTLRDFFEPHNQAFYAQVGIDFGWEKEIDDKLAEMAQAHAEL